MAETPAAGPLRLSQLGADAAAVLAVVGHFDALDAAAADPDAVLAAAARTAECPVGARWASGTVIRYDPTGRLDPDAGRPAAAPSPEQPAVWLERAGAGHPLDAVLLDRVRHLLRPVPGRAGVPVRLGDPALLEVVLSDRAPRAERARAVRLLGLDPARPVRVLAVSADSPAEALTVLTAELGDRPVRCTATGAGLAVLCAGAPAARGLSDRLDAAIGRAFPPPRPAGAGPWVGIGAEVDVLAAAASWRQARRALRFASSTGYGRRAVAYERLSALELLADVPLDRVLGHRDVVRLNEIAATPAGALEVDTAEAFCVLGSLRRAAAELHLHHSTVADRIGRIEAAMGWDLGDPVDRFTATLVLVARRMTLSSAALSGADPTAVG